MSFAHRSGILEAGRESIKVLKRKGGKLKWEELKQRRQEKNQVDIWKGAAETGRGEGEVGPAVRRQEMELERQKRSSQVER